MDDVKNVENPVEPRTESTESPPGGRLRELSRRLGRHLGVPTRVLLGAFACMILAVLTLHKVDQMQAAQEADIASYEEQRQLTALARSAAIQRVLNDPLDERDAESAGTAFRPRQVAYENDLRRRLGLPALDSQARKADESVFDYLVGETSPVLSQVLSISRGLALGLLALGPLLLLGVLLTPLLPRLAELLKNHGGSSRGSSAGVAHAVTGWFGSGGGGMAVGLAAGALVTVGTLSFVVPGRETRLDPEYRLGRATVDVGDFRLAVSPGPIHVPVAGVASGTAVVEPASINLDASGLETALGDFTQNSERYLRLMENQRVERMRTELATLLVTYERAVAAEAGLAAAAQEILKTLSDIDNKTKAATSALSVMDTEIGQVQEDLVAVKGTLTEVDGRLRAQTEAHGRELALVVNRENRRWSEQLFHPRRIRNNCQSLEWASSNLGYAGDECVGPYLWDFAGRWWGRPEAGKSGAPRDETVDLATFVSPTAASDPPPGSR